MDIFGVSGVLAVAIPFIVNYVKKIPFIGNKGAPIIALILGVIGGVAANLLGLAGDMTLIQSIIAGIGIGGASTGLYDVVKKATGG
jgi:hypothetical protein